MLGAEHKKKLYFARLAVKAKGVLNQGLGGSDKLYLHHISLSKYFVGWFIDFTFTICVEFKRNIDLRSQIPSKMTY